MHDVVDHPVAGKTGTTDSNRTASLVVTTTTLAVAGIMADPDWPETPESMDHNKINPAVYETLADAMKGKPKVDFPAPSRNTAYGNQKTIPDVSCDSVDDGAQPARGGRLRGQGRRRPGPVELLARARSPTATRTAAASRARRSP